MIPISQYRIKTTHNILQPRPAIAVTVFRRLSHVDCSTCPSPTQHVQNVTIPHARCATKDVSRKGTHIHRSSTPHTPIHQNLQPLQQSLRSFPSSLHSCTQSTRTFIHNRTKHVRNHRSPFSHASNLSRYLSYTHSAPFPTTTPFPVPFSSISHSLSVIFFFFVSFPIFCVTLIPF